MFENIKDTWNISDREVEELEALARDLSVKYTTVTQPNLKSFILSKVKDGGASVKAVRKRYL